MGKILYLPVFVVTCPATIDVTVTPSNETYYFWANSTTDMRDLQLFITVKDRYYTGEYPAWTGVGVTALAMPGLMVEIKCVAMLKD